MEVADSLNHWHVISIEEVLWGSCLIVLTMIMHAIAMPATLSVSGRLQRYYAGRESFRSGVFILLLASLVIVTAHMLEVAAWAGFFTLKGAFPNISSAYYFSLMQFTTVGSELALPERWRLLGGMIAMAGLLTFAWSTTVLLALAQRFQEEELHRLSLRHPRKS